MDAKLAGIDQERTSVKLTLTPSDTEPEKIFEGLKRANSEAIRYEREDFMSEEFIMAKPNGDMVNTKKISIPNIGVCLVMITISVRTEVDVIDKIDQIAKEILPESILEDFERKLWKIGLMI